jgi:hypothetical protein
MADVARPPKISEGALLLLRHARRSDRHNAIVTNEALRAALDFSEDLIRACHANTLSALSSLLKPASPLRSFLMITALSLQHIRERLDRIAHDESHPPKAPAVIDFNRHVFQGFAQALADLAWPERSAQDFNGLSTEQDFNGPSPKVFLSRMSQHDLYTLRSRMLQHYLANILEDYLAAVREEEKDLAPDIEANVRSSDARLLAEYAMRLVERMGDKGDNPEAIIEALDNAMKKSLGRKWAT